MGMGGGGVFLAGFLLLLISSVEDGLALICFGRVFERCLVTSSSVAADDLDKSAMLSSTLTLRYRLLDAAGTLDCRVPSRNQAKDECICTVRVEQSDSPINYKLTTYVFMIMTRLQVTMIQGRH